MKESDVIEASWNGEINPMREREREDVAVHACIHG